MMDKNNRPKGMSLLDFLWVNYAGLSTSNTISDNPESTILTQKAVQELIELSSGKSVNNILLKDTYLVGTDFQGTEVFRIPGFDFVSSFTKRIITQEDRLNGCELPLDTLVYSLKLTSGNEYLVPINTYTGASTKSIAVSIIENAVYADLKINNQASVVTLNETSDGIQADLKISDKESSILFNKESDGLSANIVLGNSDKFLKFSLLTLDEFQEIEDPDPTTVYFIKGQKFFYFGNLLMVNGGSGGAVELDNYYTKLQIDKKLQELASKEELTLTKEELEALINKQYFNWNDI